MFENRPYIFEMPGEVIISASVFDGMERWFAGDGGMEYSPVDLSAALVSHWWVLINGIF